MSKARKAPSGDPIFELTPEEVTTRWNSLTAREMELLRFYAMGKTNKVISDEAGISLKTLDVHRANLTRKLATKPWGFGRYYFAARTLNLSFKEANTAA